MGLPSPPLALDAAYLALLQQRPAPQSASRTADPSPPDPARPAPPPANGTGRGRLIDIFA
jgi:hypothetical protein